jgi:3',5'-cyclic-nucleotide phosphodiesterase
MEYAACNVVYVDRTAVEDRLVKRDEIISSHPAIKIEDSDDGHSANLRSTSPVEGNLKTLLGMFSEGWHLRDPASLTTANER